MYIHISIYIYIYIYIHIYIYIYIFVLGTAEQRERERVKSTVSLLLHNPYQLIKVGFRYVECFVCGFDAFVFTRCASSNIHQAVVGVPS